jgi:hypothetical protein
MRDATLEIRGMHCDGCAARVRMLLEREPRGVKRRCYSPRGRRGSATIIMRSPSRGGSS